MTGVSAKTDEPISAKLLIIIVAGVQFIVPFLESATYVALPEIGRALDASAFQLSLIQTALHLGIASFVVPAGRFADIHGRKKVFIFGMIATCAAAPGLALAGNIALFLVLRFIMGIGAAMIVTTSFAIITTVFPAGKRGRVMGVIIGAVYLGTTLGPSISGFIIDYMGWRSIFYLIGGAELLILILILLRFKGEWITARGEPYDWISAGVFIISMCLIVYGTTELNRADAGKWLALSGLVGLGFFARLQWRSSYPIFDVHLLVDNLGFTASNMATFINYAAYASFMFFFTLYLQIVKGFPPKYAGLLLLAQPLMQTLLAPITGRLADSYRPAYIATIGMGVCTIGLFMAGTIDAGTSLPMIIFTASLVGASLGLFASSNMTAIMECVEPRHVGAASSMVATMRSSGRLVSAMIIAIFLSYFMGDRQVTRENADEFIHVMHTALYFFSAMSLVGTFFSMITGRQKNRELAE